MVAAREVDGVARLARVLEEPLRREQGVRLADRDEE